MKTKILHNTNECTPLAIPESGFLDVHTWIFDELASNQTNKHLFILKVKWQAIVKQGRKEMSIIWYEEAWNLEFEDLVDEQRELQKIYDDSFEVFEYVFKERTTQLDYGSMQVEKPISLIEEHVDEKYEMMKNISQS
jgi:hypothetical protein